MTELFAAGAPDVLYIVDLSSYVLRAYHAIAPLSSPAGEPTHAVHGTVSMIERLLRECRPVLTAIAMDSGRATFRKQIYDAYKANRPPAPADLRQQMQRCEQVVRALGMAIFKQDGVEADDLIAAAVKLARAQGLRVVIVAADKDLMQLVGDDVVLWDTMRSRVFGVPEVEERFGVKVAQLRDLLALTGDSSDNIPGVPSVGPKTAMELLNAHGSLAGIYADLDQIKKKPLRDKLAEYREQAFVSQELVTLKDDCLSELDVALLRGTGRDLDALRSIYRELGFQRQLTALDTAPSIEAASKPAIESLAAPSPEDLALPETVVIASLEELGIAVAHIQKAGRVGLSVETNVPSAMRGVLTGIALSWEPGRSVYVPVGHRYMGAPPQLSLSDVRPVLGGVLADPQIKKLGFDLKRAAVILEQHGIALAGYAFDARLASYLLDPEARGEREPLVQRELGLVLTSLADLTPKKRGAGLDFDEVSIPEAAPFAGASSACAVRLADKLTPRLIDTGLDKLFEEMELPLASLLARMEEAGVLVDSAHLGALGRTAEHEIQRLEKQAHESAKRPFNVNSPRQLETLLFDELGLKPLRRTKTARSTDAETLEALASEHELPRLILEIRQIAKLKGTYMDALPLLVNPKTGRIHTSWEQAVAATGRLSSTDPNLQNIPIRTELGRKIREAFIAAPGHTLVSADYSQIELRVLAHLSEDPVLLDAFRSGQDIHTRTAMEIFDVKQEELTREHRTRAKAVNFGVIYGQGDSGLAKSLGIPRIEASNFIAAYFRRYEGVRRFMNETLERARAGEAVRSALGRRRLLPTIRSANRAERLAAERIAMNMPIQGTAADILKLAMLALAEAPTPGARMILTVHDELVFEVPDAEVAAAKALIKSKMEGVFPLLVPLVVDVGEGRNWNAAH